MGRLSNATIIVLGFSVSLIILSFSYFWYYVGDYDSAKGQTQLAEALKENASDIQKAEDRKEKAETKVAQAFDNWRRIVVNHAPPTSIGDGGMNMAVSGYYMPIDAHQYRNSLQAAVNDQVRVGGVKVINGPTIPDPGDSGPEIVSNFFNYPAIPFPVVIFDLGQITVQGSFDQIKANVLGWATMPNYFAVSDGLALNGTSPILTGTYSVSMIGYIRGTTIYPGLPTTVAPENVPKPKVVVKVVRPAAKPALAKPALAKPPVGKAAPLPVRPGPAGVRPGQAPVRPGQAPVATPAGARGTAPNTRTARPGARPGAAPGARGPAPAAAGPRAAGGKGGQ